MNKSEVAKNVAELVKHTYQEKELSDREYEDVLSRLSPDPSSLETKLLNAGFVPRHCYGSNGKTRYYEKNNENYVIPINGTEVYLTEREFNKKAGYYSIGTKYKHSGKMPCTMRNGRNIDCHKDLYPTKDGLQVDHKNHCLNYFTRDNLRYCTGSQNLVNRQINIKPQKKWNKNSFSWIVRNDYINDEVEIQLQKLGISIEKFRDTSKVTSSKYNTKQELYAVMTQASYILFGEFVYDLGNDFSHEYGTYLLIHIYVFGDITYEEARRFNLAYWKDIVSNNYSEESYEYACTCIKVA